jgi:ribonuclease H / adenosylcobalamin/alpha-ribazole phosphatase
VFLSVCEPDGVKTKVICDGRGNGGTGARAACLLRPGGDWIDRAEKISATTNIVAEHLSIQLGIELAVEHGVTDLLIVNDSQVPVYQLTKKYAVKQAHLKPLVERTWEMASELDTVAFEWVPRQETTRADLLCREVDRPPG